MNPDLIVMDMDDTLMTSDNTLSQNTKEYLIDIQKEGLQIALASGRPTEAMTPTAKALKMDDYHSYIISYNGAKTIDLAHNEVVSVNLIDKSSFDNIVDFCRDKGLFVLTYVDGEIIYDDEHEYMNLESEITGLPMKRVEDLKSFINDAVPKVIGVDYEDHINELFQKMENGFDEDIDVTMSKPFFLEFMSKEVSKGAAIQYLADKLDLDTQNMIAFGDSQNDVEMFKAVGTAVAMDNAVDTLKEYATYVTKSNDEDGIPYQLKSLLDV
ncbi:Cof-type HAD-IIB family hydrolase [Staphylococcus sp. 11261D007BR]